MFRRRQWIEKLFDVKVLAVVTKRDTTLHMIAVAPPTLSDVDHIGDINEMIVQPMPAVETGDSGPVDHLLKFAVIRIAQPPRPSGERVEEWSTRE